MEWCENSITILRKWSICFLSSKFLNKKKTRDAKQNIILELHHEENQSMKEYSGKYH